MFSKTLVLSALAALATAQSSVLTFTNVPNPVTDGKAQAITYATNDTSSPVTIILRQGPSSNLQDVETLTTSATGGQYIWTPSSSLPNGNNYALQIKQGDQINYFGPFSVQGQSSSASASVSASPVASANSTTSVPVLVTPVGTGASASGTGSPMSRNTTMSKPTLTASTTGSATASSTDDAGFQGTGTSSAGGSESTGAASSFQIGSGIALFGAIAAGIFLQ